MVINCTSLSMPHISQQPATSNKDTTDHKTTIKVVYFCMHSQHLNYIGSYTWTLIWAILYPIHLYGSDYTEWVYVCGNRSQQLKKKIMSCAPPCCILYQASQFRYIDHVDMSCVQYVLHVHQEQTSRTEEQSDTTQSWEVSVVTKKGSVYACRIWSKEWVLFQWSSKSHHVTSQVLPPYTMLCTHTTA